MARDFTRMRIQNHLPKQKEMLEKMARDVEKNGRRLLLGVLERERYLDL